MVAGGGGQALADTNFAGGDNSVISGGASNTADGDFSTVSGGRHNTASGDSSVVTGGTQNNAQGRSSFIGGGQNNATGDHGSVSGGEHNKALGDFAVVAGGGGPLDVDSNSAVGNWTFIGGGSRNTVNSSFGTISGGNHNTALGSYATVGGGQDNAVSSNLSSYATVSGGGRNNAAGYGATAGGGTDNVASNTSATVSGGEYNTASGDHAVVSGGINNRARGAYSVVAGGGWLPPDSNSAIGQNSVIGGGARNNAAGAFSVIPGGHDNSTTLANSLAAGSNAQANNTGSFVWGSSSTDDITSSYSSYTVTFRCENGARFYTASSGTGTGVVLAPGGASWNSISDSTKKRNRRSVDTKIILEKVSQLPIQQWSYKSQDPFIEHIGPMAQDFWKEFHVGDDSLTISTIDPGGITLAAIQELAKENAELKARLARVESLLQSSTAGTHKALNEER